MKLTDEAKTLCTFKNTHTYIFGLFLSAVDGRKPVFNNKRKVTPNPEIKQQLTAKRQHLTQSGDGSEIHS